MSINILENNNLSKPNLFGDIFSEKINIITPKYNILYLVFGIILLVVLYCCYYITTNVDVKESFYSRTLLSTIYGVKSARNQNHIENKKEEEEAVLEIGHDEKENKIFKYKNSIYTMNDQNVLVTTEPKNITYKKVHTKLPVKITADKIKSLIPLKFRDHKFRGLINNYWYRQYYILYEKEYDNQNLKNKYYTYLLVKNIDNKLSVIHKIPPRERIMYGDTIYFSFGNFELGPLQFL